MRLPKDLLATAGLALGDEVEIMVRGEEITIRKPRGKKTDLAELVARLPSGYRGNEDPFGKAAGKEQW